MITIVRMRPLFRKAIRHTTGKAGERTERYSHFVSHVEELADMEETKTLLMVSKSFVSLIGDAQSRVD